MPFHPLPRDGVIKFNPRGVQHQTPGHKKGLIGGIQVTAQNGMADGLAMDPQLMSTSRQRPEEHPGGKGCLQPRNRLIVGHGRFACGITDLL